MEKAKSKRSVFPEGHVHWFYRCFKWCSSKDIVLFGEDERTHTLVCNRAVYTTDGRFFIGWYTGDEIYDLDEFNMMPPDFLLCCQCCCYMCCECHRKKYDAEGEREFDLFYGKGKDDVASNK
jgi:hypothetical protein